MDKFWIRIYTAVAVCITSVVLMATLGSAYSDAAILRNG